MDWMGPSAHENVKYENPMVEELWEDVPRLKDFEKEFWKAGGKTVRAACSRCTINILTDHDQKKGWLELWLIVVTESNICS